MRPLNPVSAPPEQREGITALRRLMAQGSASATYRLVGPSGREIPIPDSVFHVLERVAEVLARGDAVTVVPVGQVLTTQQAADILNISRQYLIRLLDGGEIPYSRTGTHRRIRIEDLLEYKRLRDQERLAALDRLSEMSQDFGGDDEIP